VCKLSISLAPGAACNCKEYPKANRCGLGFAHWSASAPGAVRRV